MIKFALPVLVLLIFGLFYYSITPPPLEIQSGPTAAPAATIQTLADAQPVKQDSEQQLAKTLDSIRAELKRLSDDAKANSDKIAQTVRSDPQDADKPGQIVLDQIDALRSDQAKIVADAKVAAQATRQEIAASQNKLVAEVGDALKAGTARSEALAQSVDAMKKDIDDVKKKLEEDRQNVSGISPGLALVVALAALVLGPFVARQLTASQLAAAKNQAAAEAAVAAQRQTAAAASPSLDSPPAAAGSNSRSATAERGSRPS